MKRTLKFTLFLISFLVISVTFGQKKNSWTTWEKLYSDNQIKVEIQFKIRSNGCQTQKTSKFRYRLTGRLYRSKQYVYWKMKYKDCNGTIQEAKNQVRISVEKSGDVTTVDNMLFESMDDRFMTQKVVKKFYNVNINGHQNKQNINNQENSSEWTRWRKLYGDSRMKVKVQFQVPKKGCQNNQRSKYRYLVIGKGKRDLNEYVSWNLKYRSCKGKMIKESKKLRVRGSKDKNKILESLDYRFTARSLSKTKYRGIGQKNDYRIAPEKSSRPMVFKFGAGLYSDLGLTRNLDFESVKSANKFYPYLTTGLFFKLSKWREKHPRNHLLGVVLNGGFFQLPNDGNTYGYIHPEFGVYFWETLRLSGGYWLVSDNKYLDTDLNKPTFTAGLTFKVFRRMQIDLNHVLFLDESPSLRTSQLHAGIQLSID